MSLSAVHKPVSFLLVTLTLALSSSYSIGHSHVGGSDAHWLGIGLPVRNSEAAPPAPCCRHFHQHFVVLGFEFYLSQPATPTPEPTACDQVAVGLPCDGERLEVTQISLPSLAMDILPEWSGMTDRLLAVPTVSIQDLCDHSPRTRQLDDASRFERSGVLLS